MSRRSSAAYLGKPVINNVFDANQKVSYTKEFTLKKRFVPGVGSYQPNDKII